MSFQTAAVILPVDVHLKQEVRSCQQVISVSLLFDVCLRHRRHMGIMFLVDMFEFSCWCISRCCDMSF